MWKSAKTIMLAGLALVLAGTMVPARAATPEQAQALAEKAATLVASQGEKAFPAFDDPKGEYVDGDLYVVVVDHEGVVRANINPKIIGVNMWEATDPDGVKFTQLPVQVGDATGTGWFSYKFTNPVSKKIQVKKAWVHKVGDFYVFSGAYIE